MKIKSEEWEWQPSGSWLSYVIQADHRERPWSANPRNPRYREIPKTKLIPSKLHSYTHE